MGSITVSPHHLTTAAFLLGWYHLTVILNASQRYIVFRSISKRLIEAQLGIHSRNRPYKQSHSDVETSDLDFQRSHLQKDQNKLTYTLQTL